VSLKIRVGAIITKVISSGKSQNLAREVAARDCIVGAARLLQGLAEAFRASFPARTKLSPRAFKEVPTASPSAWG